MASNKKVNLPFSALRVLSQNDAWWAVVKDPFHWNVISIWNELEGKEESLPPDFNEKTKDLCQQKFHDLTRARFYGDILCNDDHLAKILSFARSKYGEPLIVHCHAGISRSSAITFLILLDYFKDKSKNPVDDALQLLVVVKPINLIRPNSYIVKLGMYHIAENEDIAMEWIRAFFDHPITPRFFGGTMYLYA